MTDAAAGKRDTYFDEHKQVSPFEFNEKVAHVFDDMAQRSIPYYGEVQKMVSKLAATFYQDNSRIYDLGCSTGTSLALIYQALTSNQAEGIQLIGIDNSMAMCQETREKLDRMTIPSSAFKIINGDLLDAHIEDASVVIMNYTLQFIDPLKRERIIRNIYTGLNHNGILLVSDKTLQNHTDTSRIFIDNYYDLKRRNGYSELEISRKREALENVLIPYKLDEEKDLFRRCGFESVDLFFTWYNFSSFICLKKGGL